MFVSSRRLISTASNSRTGRIGTKENIADAAERFELLNAGFAIAQIDGHEVRARFKVRCAPRNGYDVPFLERFQMAHEIAACVPEGAGDEGGQRLSVSSCNRSTVDHRGRFCPGPSLNRRAMRHGAQVRAATARASRIVIQDAFDVSVQTVRLQKGLLKNYGHTLLPWWHVCTKTEPLSSLKEPQSRDNDEPEVTPRVKMRWYQQSAIYSVLRGARG
jgi:hypothetical protein